VRLAQNIKGVSKLAVALLILISFLLGATLSYIWTMGYYAPNEFNLPSQTSLTIEGMPAFFAENATYFNITVLNPSYSPTEAKIESIKVITSDGRVHIVDSASPPLPLTLAPGKSQIIQSFWNWGNYTGQTVDVYVLIADGSGPAVQVKIGPKVELDFFNIVFFNTTETSFYFNVTIQNAGTPPAKQDVDLLTVNVEGQTIPIGDGDVVPPLPQTIEPNTSLQFTCTWDWSTYQGKNAAITVSTVQGFTATSAETAIPSMP